MTWQLLADAVLCSHVALMVFVVLGLPLIVVANLRRCGPALRAGRSGRAWSLGRSGRGSALRLTCI